MVWTDLAGYLATRQLLLMSRWRERVRRERDQPATRLRLSDTDLDNHLPSLIHKLAQALRIEGTSEVEPEGAAHGHQRRTLGYSMPELLREFRLFRQVLMDCLCEYQAHHRAGTDEEIGQARELILDV